MRGKLLFVSGLAAGFVLGARAGREKYEELVARGRKVLDNPTVQEAAGVAQAQANRLYSEGKDRLSQTKLGEKLMPTNGSGGQSELTSAGQTMAGRPGGATSGSTSSGAPSGATAGGTSSATTSSRRSTGGSSSAS